MDSSSPKSAPAALADPSNGDNGPEPPAPAPEPPSEGALVRFTVGGLTRWGCFTGNTTSNPAMMQLEVMSIDETAKQREEQAIKDIVKDGGMAHLLKKHVDDSYTPGGYYLMDDDCPYIMISPDAIDAFRNVTPFVHDETHYRHEWEKIGLIYYESGGHTARFYDPQRVYYPPLGSNDYLDFDDADNDEEWIANMSDEDEKLMWQEEVELQKAFIAEESDLVEAQEKAFWGRSRDSPSDCNK